jgi:hypothetical protein
MITPLWKKLKVTSISYRQFTYQLRKRIPGLSRDVIYREWNRVLRQYNGPDYDRIAKRIKSKLLTPVENLSIL